MGSRPIDLRMATLPTIYGEKVVMRVLDKSNVVLGFEDLGFDDDLLAIYRSIYTKPYGTILVTGPDRFGQDHHALRHLVGAQLPEKNIITVEDPVELRLKGINQVQLNVKAGLTFASALKSILRSDPDIVLVGEIRDRETAMISIEAALTGHLVLATLHTNNSASTPMRLVEMGLEPFLVTSALSGGAGPAPGPSAVRALQVSPTSRPRPRSWPPAGRPKSSSPMHRHARRCTGPSGARPVPTPDTGAARRCSSCSSSPRTIERLIIEGGTADDIHRLAVEQGMVTLRQSGLRKALEGETTLEEVLRVVA